MKIEFQKVHPGLGQLLSVSFQFVSEMCELKSKNLNLVQNHTNLEHFGNRPIRHMWRLVNGMDYAAIH